MSNLLLFLYDKNLWIVLTTNNTNNINKILYYDEIFNY